MKVKIISAGAGSGKTYRLTSEMVEYLRQGIRAEGIIATTFTKKAAAELQERVRVRLLESGMKAQAEALTNAMIGTVHGLGVKLLQRFAYEAGVSPDVSIIAEEDQQILFNQSLAMVLTEERVEAIERLSDRLGLSDNQHFDWRKELRGLTEVARANDFGFEVLEKSKQQSFETLVRFLDQPDQRSASDFHNELSLLLQQTADAISGGEDATKATQGVLQTIKTCQRELQLRGWLYWRQWAKLSKLKPGAKSKDIVEELTTFAHHHDKHPQLHEDIKGFIYQLFDMAVAAMQEYDAYKKQRGLIDYTDMEVLVKQLLGNPHVQDVLKEELDLLMVDEFQDTSPIQLAIFQKLASFAKQSVWVGDPKQSIYGFRGAAPELMEAIVKAAGGIDPANIQMYSWRSREDIVHTTNALFVKAFDQLPENQVALFPKRTKAGSSTGINKEAEPITMTEALRHWHFEYDPGEGKKSGRQPGSPWLENCIAFTLRDYLAGEVVIFDKKNKTYRQALPGDVAILCRSNNECQTMADALYRAGLKVAISRAGLLSTAESKLILATLKYLLNQNDSLSIAELLLLGDRQHIQDIITHRLDYLEALEESKQRLRWANENTFIQSIDALRERVAELSTVETLDLVLEELELRRIIVGWGNVSQRLDNVDVLRNLSTQYEEACNRMHSAASLGGFLLWLNELEQRGEDKQGSGEGPDAVNVMTYHRSKGLEWPVVILHSLEKGLRAGVWGMEIVPESEETDLNDILGNRWLRYWINPYDKQIGRTRLEEGIQQSPEQERKTRESLQEDNRLLYVGITRARDYIIFPTAKNPTRWLNRSWHAGKEDYPTLDADTHESPWYWKEEQLTKNTEVFYFPRTFGQHPIPEENTDYWEVRKGKALQLPAFRLDLREDKSLPEKIKVDTKELHQYLSPISLQEGDDVHELAKAVKACLTAYRTDYDKNTLTEISKGLLQRYEVDDLLSAAALEQRCREWTDYLEQKFTILNSYRKYHLWHFHGGQLLDTVVDLILETDQGLVVIQHSGFGGAQKKWRSKASELGSWFHLVKEGLCLTMGAEKVDTYLHFVLQGTLIEVETSSL